MPSVSAGHDALFHSGWRNRYPILARAEGCYVYDADGKRYLDAAGGVHVVGIGHGVQEIVDAMAAQARQVTFTYGGAFTNGPQHQLAEQLLAMAPAGFGRVMFTSGGSESNEAALTIANQYFIEKGKPSKSRVIGRWQSYHGVTVGTISMSGNVLRRRDHAAYLLDFPHINPCNCYRCPYCSTPDTCGLACAWELDLAIRREGPETIAAFIAEPLVGTTAGAFTPPPGYYEVIRQICDQHDVLFIADEVITGFGRTGRKFGSDHWQAVPDIITCAKGLASGYSPIGAVLLQEKIYDAFAQGPRGGFFLGYTYAGNPVSCATALAVQQYLARHNLVAQSATRGEYLRRRLLDLQERSAVIGDVRGKGLMLGVEFVQDKATKQPFPRAEKFVERVVATALAKGMTLIGSIGTADGEVGDHLLITPPFIITEEQCDQVVTILEDVLNEVTRT
ncbi:MAG: aminotransferase family protein [Chloroflexota bacterium]